MDGFYHFTILCGRHNSRFNMLVIRNGENRNLQFEINPFHQWIIFIKSSTVFLSSKRTPTHSVIPGTIAESVYKQLHQQIGTKVVYLFPILILP